MRKTRQCVFEDTFPRTINTTGSRSIACSDANRKPLCNAGSSSRVPMQTTTGNSD